MTERAGFKETRTHLFSLIKNRGFIPSKGRKFFDSQFLTKGVDNKAVLETVGLCLADLSKINPRLAEILEKRFKGGETIRRLASAYHLSVDQINRLQRDGLDVVTEIFLDKENDLREQRFEKMIEHLPPPNYVKLFGIDSLQTRLVGLLESEEEPWVIFVTGIGGIGKTALVNSTVRALSPHVHYESIYWFKNDQTRDLLNENQLHSTIFSALAPDEIPPSNLSKRVRQILKTRPCLVVLDGLEGELNDEWVSDLRSLVKPSRIVVISRRAPLNTTDFYLLRVNEIDQYAATELLKYQGQLTGLPDAVNHQLTSDIYESVGGNALALKIIVGMLHLFAPKHVLLALKSNKDRQPSKLFNFIFEAATNALVEPSRRALDVFLFASTTGITLEHVSAISGLQASEVTEAIEDLVQRSLIEVFSTVDERHYGIHRLTETYLASRVGATSHEISHLNLEYWLNRVKSQGSNLVRYESSNLYRAIERGMSLQQLDDCIKLLSRIHPGILSNYRSTIWLPLFILVSNDKRLSLDSECLILNKLGGLYWQVGQNKAAVEAFEKAERIAAKLKKGDQRISALLGITLNHWSAGNYNIANRTLKVAMSISRRFPLNASYKGRLLVVQGIVSYSRKKFSTAYKRLTEARKFYKENHKIQCQILIQRGLCFQLQQKYHLALKQYRKAEEALESISNHIKESNQIEILRSSAFYHMGDSRNAEAALNRALLLNQDGENDLSTQAFLESSLGRVSLSMGKKKVAKKLLQSAKKLWSKIDHPEIKMDVTGILSE